MYQAPLQEHGQGQNPSQPAILMIVHQESSDPGRIGEQLRARGFRLDIRRPCLGQELPASMADHAGCVIFGGPMSANDDHLDFLRKEIDFIPRVVASGKPYLGVCLGAQLLARAGGAKVSPHPEGWHEIGYYPVKALPAGRDYFPAVLNIFQWHGEGFDLPRGAVRLASTGWFSNQAMRIGEKTFGVQFHPEVTGAMMQRWSRMAGHRLGLPGAQARETMREAYERYDAGIAAWLDGFLEKWLSPAGAGSESAATAQNGGEEAVGAVAGGR
ncbi:MAG TPA: GMP synthase [Ferrovibrio sp.]|uniref:glutamine amidotransferase-related protein n=1 Tax=Ferrovibrio sp. TaxID=1917215 RepID=UPI002ED523C7